MEQLIAETLKTTNSRDYSEEYIEQIYLRAKRIEISASITAVEFYRKLGYDYKNGIAKIDEGQVYRLEKFR